MIALRSTFLKSSFPNGEQSDFNVEKFQRGVINWIELKVKSSYKFV